MSDRPQMGRAHGMIATPIERRKVYAQVAEQLLAQIGEGRLRPGDAVPTERALTKSFRVGRSSVREALRILESQGVIKPVGAGTFVIAEANNPLTHSLALLLALQGADLRELFEVRKILEVESAALAAVRHRDADVVAMARAIDAMVGGVGAPEQYIEADLRFHLTIASATGNRMAVHMMQAIRLPLQQALTSIYYIPGSPQRSITQHQQILHAVEARDPDAARQRMRDHLMRVEGEIERVLSSSVAFRSNGPHSGGGRG